MANINMIEAFRRSMQAVKNYIDNAISSIDLSNYALKGESISARDEYTTNCNDWLTNGYIKTSAYDTANLPSLCTGSDRWGVLFYIAENVPNGTGTQMYYPIDGTYRGRVFTRSIVSRNAGEWELLSTASDMSNLKMRRLTQAEYDAIGNKDPNTLYIIL